MGGTGSKYLIKIILDIRHDIGTNVGLTGGKYFLKIIFDIKIDFGIFEILHVPDLDKFSPFLIWGTFWA